MTYPFLELVIVGKPSAEPASCQQKRSAHHSTRVQCGLAGLALGGHRGCIKLLLTNLIPVRYCTVQRHRSAPTAHGDSPRVAIIFSRGAKGTAESLFSYCNLVRPLICCSISGLLCTFRAGDTPLKVFGYIATCTNARSHCSANFFKVVKGTKGRFVRRSASLLSVGSASTSSGTVIPSSEVPESSALTNSPSPSPAIISVGVEATAIQAKERLSGWGASVGTFFSSRTARFSAQKMPSSSMSAPSSTAGSPVPSQDAPRVQNLRASISPLTGNAKLPPRAVQTPPPGQTVAAELGEKTPREDTLSLDGDAGSQSHTPKHEDGKTQDRYDGDSDEEPSFGVAL